MALTRTVTANLTFSSQANRDAAVGRVNAALAGVPYSPRQNYLTPAGGVVLPTSTTLQISIQVDESVDADEVARALFDAITSGTRHTAGWISVNKF
jgi:hypothetical protein